jgi:hypothetical protein
LRGDRYVRNGEIVAMLPDRFSPFLMATAESELDRHLVPRAATLERVSIDGEEVPGVLADWSAVVATHIRAGHAEPAPAGTRVELGFDNGSALTYRIDRSTDTPIAWRTQPDLGFELDPAILDRLLGEHGGPAP